MVAWGLYNSFGFAFSPQGKLYVTENAFDVRGHRRAWGARRRCGRSRLALGMAGLIMLLDNC
jgi:hypothetical protein